jgi:8-oxo-dGTP pyrophosphatase MutT (NUDIX family)
MPARDQAGVIPFRRIRDVIEICLIRNSGRRKWKIPKGFIDPGETVQQAALKEAWEEAGLRGRLVGDAIGSYRYTKWNLDLTVVVFLMEVRSEEDEWAESRLRQRDWTTIDEAIRRLKKHPVKVLLADATTRLEGKKGSRKA